MLVRRLSENNSNKLSHGLEKKITQTSIFGSCAKFCEDCMFMDENIFSRKNVKNDGL